MCVIGLILLYKTGINTTTQEVLYLFVVLNLGRMNEMRDCNLKFGVVTLYYIGVIYLLIDYEMFVYICLLLYFNTHFEQHSCASSGFTKWK